MKTIGLIGGVCWRVTANYYEQINHRINQQLGGQHSAHISLVSVDHEQVARLQHVNDMQGLADLLVNAARRAECAGANMLALCSEYMHFLADEIQAAIDIPLVRMREPLKKTLAKQNLQRLGLLGSREIIDDHLFVSYMEDTLEVDILVPQRTPFQRELQQFLTHQSVTPVQQSELVSWLQAQVTELKEGGAEALLLTERRLTQLLADVTLDIPVLDTMQLHVEHIVEHALQPEVSAWDGLVSPSVDRLEAFAAS